MLGYCCECSKEVECKIVSGKTIYPHRPDLHSFKFIRHSACGNYTGYYQGEHPTLPSKHIRQCRRKAHQALDSIWKDRKKKAKYYAFMSDNFNKNFHWGEVKSDSEADKALKLTMDYLGGVI